MRPQIAKLIFDQFGTRVVQKLIERIYAESSMAQKLRIALEPHILGLSKVRKTRLITISAEQEWKSYHCEVAWAMPTPRLGVCLPSHHSQLLWNVSPQVRLLYSLEMHKEELWPFFRKTNWLSNTAFSLVLEGWVCKLRDTVYSQPAWSIPEQTSAYDPKRQLSQPYQLQIQLKCSRKGKNSMLSFKYTWVRAYFLLPRTWVHTPCDCLGSMDVSAHC